METGQLDDEQSALLVEDAALRFHLESLRSGLSKQQQEISCMIELHNKKKCSENVWHTVLCSHANLTNCLSLYLKRKTRLTYMHMAVVSRLSESYEYNLEAAKYYYNDTVQRESLCRAQIAQKSAKYLSYAMMAEREGDSVLQSWCLKAADALQSALCWDDIFYRYFDDRKRFISLYTKHTAKAQEAVDKNHLTLGSAHTLLARYFKMRAAAVLICRYSIGSGDFVHYNEIVLKHQSLLEEAERLFSLDKVVRANALVSLVLSHAHIDDLRADFRWDEVAHIFDAALSYSEGIDVPIVGDLEANFCAALWSRGLYLPRNSFSETLIAYAANLKQSLATLDSRDQLCKKRGSANTALGRTTCAALWRHIYDLFDGLSSEIVYAAKLLTESDDMSGCVSWEVQRAKIDDFDRWIKIADLMDEVFAKLEIWTAQRDRCQLTSGRFPLIVRTVIAEIWEKAFQILTPGLHDLEVMIKVDNEFVYPDQDFKLAELWDGVSTKVRYFALLATALHSEVTRCMNSTLKAQALGASEVATKYTELACIAAEYLRTMHNSITNDTQMVVYQWPPFQVDEINLLNKSSEMLDKALLYFSCVENSALDRLNGLAVSELWSEVYEQQLIVAESCMSDDSKAVSDPELAIEYLLLRIEQLAISSPVSLLESLQQLACHFAVSVTKPKGRNVLWLSSARGACGQACKVIAPEGLPIDEMVSPRQIALATRLRCAAMCYDALASTPLTEKDITHPLVLSAKLLSFTVDGWDPCSKICKHEEGISFLNDTVIALLDGSPHADLVEGLRNSVSMTTEPLREQVRALVKVNEELNNCAAAIVVASAESDENGVRLWRIVESVLYELKTMIFQHSLYLLDSSSPNVQSKYFQLWLRFQRLQLAAMAYNNDENFISHCYEMASVTDVGSRQKHRHEACMKRYLDIIDSAPSDDVALTALKVTAADHFRDLTDKNKSRHDEGVLVLHSKSADVLVDAYVAGQQAQTEKHALLLQASALLTEAAMKTEAASKTHGQQSAVLSKEAGVANKKAEKNLASAEDVDRAPGDVNRNKKKNGQKNKK